MYGNVPYSKLASLELGNDALAALCYVHHYCTLGCYHYPDSYVTLFGSPGCTNRALVDMVAELESRNCNRL